MILLASATASYTHADIAAIQSSIIHNSKPSSPSFVGAATEIFKKFLMRASALGNCSGRGGKPGGNARSRKGTRGAIVAASGTACDAEDDVHESHYLAMCE